MSASTTPNRPKKSHPPKRRYEPNYSCGCSCEVCHCGPNCQCTETLCRCEASSVLNSLTGSHSNSPVTSPRRLLQKQSSSCCSSNRKTAKPPNQANGDTNAGIATPVPSNGENLETEGTGENGNERYKNIMMEVDVEVLGMACSMCTKSVETALKNMTGITKVTVSLALNLAHVEFDTTQTSYDEIVDTIEAIGYEVPPPPENDSATTAAATVEFTVSGMTCSMCTQAITRALEAVQGVDQTTVSLSTNQAIVHYDRSITSVAELKEAIEDVGYDVTDVVDTVSDDVARNNTDNGDAASSPSNMMTPDRLDRLLEQQQKEVNSRKRAFVSSLLGTLPILVLTMVLPHFPSLKFVKWLQRPVVFLHHTFVLEALILWVLATPIQFWCGYPFYKSSYYGLRQGVMGMDVLIAVGTSASYGYAVWAALAGGMEYHFFETSAVLICFVLLGKWMQTLAVRRTSQALTHLLQLQPRTAIKVITPADSIRKWNPLKNDPYSEEVVPITAIRTGDYVKVLKGSSIPADGIIRFGEMTVDESMITGESIPVLKTKGAVVLGGTICAEAGQEAGACFVLVTGVGSNTALSQILQLVQDAQNRQVPIQNLADTISGYFVPTVIILSIVTFMVWYALVQSGVVPVSMLPDGESPATFSLLFAIACVVCSCPCALGLATPTAVMVGTGVGAKQGVLMKGGETLELASNVDAIVFDKTGTLTKGKPAITDFSVLVPDDVFWREILGRDPEALKKGKGLLPVGSTLECLLWLLASLERNSEHLLAAAIVEYAEAKLANNIPDAVKNEASSEMTYAQPSNFLALTGRGASGRILGDIDVSVGNRAFCEVQGFEISEQVENNMRRLERHGKTAIVAAINGIIVLVMGIADELKPDASASVVFLKEKLGVDVWMVTGDNRRTARAIAQQLNIPENRVIAEALPVAKVEKVQELQEQGHVVAMVGDGVNDSPALVQADVGLSMGTGAEIAAEASDMVLVRGNVSDVCTALDLSRVIFNRIKLNFLWSLLYNCLSIPLAAGVFYPMVHTRLPPTLAALAMALSSISVVSSSLSLRLYSPPNVQSARSITSFSDQHRRRGRQTSSSSSEADDTSDSMQEPLLARRLTEPTGNLSRLEEGTLSHE
ncbi:ATPase P [Nitzschia inconspicua]|uniref:P-type Cu(+) transporter n=1 Tax=Nitzschia inconspicua TaxID=303405 RepID=A0A9K3PTE5_9STRA|nr:ATPase P [Nitzschia inconspicua]